MMQEAAPGGKDKTPFPSGLQPCKFVAEAGKVSGHAPLLLDIVSGEQKEYSLKLETASCM